MADETATPQCLLDFWMKNTVKEIAECAEKGLPFPPHSTDYEVAHLMLDFLFASQDASTSSLTFAIHELGLHPDVLSRVRAEQTQFRPNKETIDGDMIATLHYTWQVMKEILRVRPPATIVPYVAVKEYKMPEQNYTAPPGTVIIPSVWSSNRTGFEQPELFDPDRFDNVRQEHKKYEKNFLTFGAGPHYCLGQRYAMNNIMAFISIFVQECDFVRQETPDMHKLIYMPTIYPADGVVLSSFTRRTDSTASASKEEAQASSAPTVTATGKLEAVC